MAAKGLELQETSCHHAEALKIDEIFDAAFENQDSVWSKSAFHTLTPVATTSCRAYSHSKMSLAGIIHSNDNLKAITDLFLKTLVWNFHRKLMEGGLLDK